mgnify:CR=1 FL=1
MRIGIFGGTFDPIHLGHLILAETCLVECQLDQIRFLPTYCSPHKTNEKTTSAKQRQYMLDFATAGIPEFVVDPREIKKGEVCYSVDTLTELRAEFPEDELFFLIGADSLNDFPTWREPEKIAELATIAAVNRGQMSEAEIDEMCLQLPDSVRKSVQIIQMPGIEISASMLRDRASKNLSVRFLTPRPVERYITEQKLYQISDE